VTTRESRRLLTEGVVIVGSILLAFAIDAAWQSLGERQRLQQLELSLRTDIEATRQAMISRRDWAADVTRGARAILSGIADGATGADLDSLVFSVGSVFVKGYWAPINHTYEQALGAGDLALVEDAELRFMLGRYAEALDGLGDHQSSVVTQYYGQLEPFMVEHTDYAQVAWETSRPFLVRGPFTTDSETLAAQREFSNLLNLKLELEIEATTALQAAIALAEELLAMLKE
jgi:hypothetical protein